MSCPAPAWGEVASDASLQPAYFSILKWLANPKKGPFKKQRGEVFGRNSYPPLSGGFHTMIQGIFFARFLPQEGTYQLSSF
jgi:hypothetical protein